MSASSSSNVFQFRGTNDSDSKTHFTFTSPSAIPNRSVGQNPRTNSTPVKALARQGTGSSLPAHGTSDHAMRGATQPNGITPTTQAMLEEIKKQVYRIMTEAKRKGEDASVCAGVTHVANGALRTSVSSEIDRLEHQTLDEIEKELGPILARANSLPLPPRVETAFADMLKKKSQEFSSKVSRLYVGKSESRKEHLPSQQNGSLDAKAGRSSIH